jgi:hypothetical protein
MVQEGLHLHRAVARILLEITPQDMVPEEAVLSPAQTIIHMQEEPELQAQF